MKFEFWQSFTYRAWFWLLKADDGTVIAASQGYATEQQLREAIATIKKSAEAEIVAVKAPD